MTMKTITNKECTKKVNKKKRDSLYAFLTTKNKDIYSKLAK